MVGRYDSKFAAPIGATANRAVLAQIEHSQKFRLEVRREAANFVEEDRSAVCLREMSRNVGYRASESAADLTE
jgi:hypothetical protein